MHTTDYRQRIDRIDSTNQYEVIRSFPSHLEEAFLLPVPQSAGAINPVYIRNVIVCGMGGSAIGGDVLRTYLFNRCPVPIQTIRGYALPSYIDKETLVIAASYSGGTEETLSCYHQAHEAGCEIVAITSGGELGKLAAEHGYPIVSVPGGFAPRAALGYLFIRMLQVVRDIFTIPVDDEIREAIAAVQKRTLLYEDPNGGENEAKSIADALNGCIPLIYSAADPLEAVNMRWRCQIEENAKTLAYGNLFPELNHNEIVGWEQNPDLLKRLFIIVLHDKDQHPQIGKRIAATLELIAGSAAGTQHVRAEDGGLLARLLCLIHLGDWVSFYLAINSEVDPYPIPKIDHLKRVLAENR